MTAPVFASAVTLYHRAGWPAILPVPPDKKWPPPGGFTGAHGADTPPEQLVEWVANGKADYSVALRMPDGVIGIDVDHYTKTKVTDAHPEGIEVVKRGNDTLAELERRWGPLPPTWSSTARGDDHGPGPSRIMLFRVPPGRYRTKFPDVEIIQRHHRYAVVAPSRHESGAVYRWYRPDGTPADEGEVPRPSDLAELPEAWVKGLREGASEDSPAPADVESGAALLARLRADDRPPCAEITDAREQARIEMSSADAGSRHDTMTARVHRVIMLGAAGHPGCGPVLAELERLWADATPGEDREGEFDRMCLSSARKAVTAVGDQSTVDPCLMFGAYEVAAPSPIDDRGKDHDGEPLPGPIGDSVPYSWRHVIGTHTFDPDTDLDQTIAEAILERTRGMILHASDSGGWIQRGPIQWELYGDLTRRAVAETANLMPTGDPTPPAKGTPPTREQRQFARRKRLMTNAGANAVAAMMRALVTGGWHPSAVKLAELDSDPELLWAGGMPYDLRRSVDGPAFSERTDPSTPHLMSAGVKPEIVPTPHWDRFIRHVWPDDDIRAWVLRVLSITLTGYADAALPILWGEGGTGKTSTIELIMSVLGSYAHAANPKLLTGDYGHDAVVFALKGRRLSFIDEGPREGRWAQERLKQLTGGGQLTANAMHSNPITFKPTHTLVLTSNNEPNLSDEAIRRRVRLIPCTGDPEAVRAARAAITPDVWRREAPGVLAMLMREAALWLRDPDSALPSAAPAALRAKVDELAEQQDIVAGWVAERCEPWPAGVLASDLYAAFVAHCRALNIRSIPSQTAWGRRLTELGYPAERRRDGAYRPLRIRPGGGGWGTVDNPVDNPVDNSVDDPGRREQFEGLCEQFEGLCEQLGGPTVHARLPRSDQVFEGRVNSVNGLLPIFSRNATRENTTPNGVREGGGVQRGEKNRDQTVHTVHTGGSKPALTSANEREQLAPQPFTQPFTTVHAGTRTVHAAPGAAAQHPSASEPAETRQSSQRVTDAEVAARAYQGRKRKVMSKAEARRQIKEERRRAAIEAAQGEVHALPAAVDRQGTIRSLTVEQAAETVRAAVQRSGALTVDVETSGYPVGHRHYVLRSVQLGDDEVAVVFDPAEHADIIRQLLTEAPRLHAHSASADLVPLADAGLVDAEDAWARMHDTVVLAKLSDPESTGSDPSLKRLAGAVLAERAVSPAAEEGRKAVFRAGRWLEDVDVDTPPERSGWAQIETASAAMLRYAASDVLDTAALAKALPAHDTVVVERERLAQRMTARITHRGVPLDFDRVLELTAPRQDARDETRAKLRDEFGIANPGSPSQVAAKLVELGLDLPRTATGRPSVEGEVLESAAVNDEHPEAAELARLVLEYREHDKVLSTYLGPYRALCEYADGRVRPTIYTVQTRTGRMSCARPNLQQVPKVGGVRSCITSDPGYVMIGADFSSVEVRVAAALSQDDTLLRYLAEGKDLHTEVALRVWGADPEETAKNGGVPTPKKAHRYLAKRIVFGRLYGGGVATLAKQTGVSQEVTRAAVEALDALTPQLAAWSRQLQQAARMGYSEFPAYSGRIIHLPQQTPYKAANYCVQGTARELLVDALIRWSGTKWGTCTLLPVHDELDVWVPAEDADEATRVLVECMETELFGVRIEADPRPPAKSWPDST